MRSSFSRPRQQVRASATARVDEVYDLKGLNLVAPDQIMPKGESPNVLNSRMYASEDDENRVAARTRRGVTVHSQPIGHDPSVENVAAVTDDLGFTTTTWRAQPFTPDASGVLYGIDLWLKRVDGTSGPAIVKIYSNNAGVPGDLLGQSSPSTSLITTSYQYLNAAFVDAPSVTSGTQYWIVTHIQEEGQGTYYLGQTAASGAYTSTNSGGTWSALGASFRFKTYLATAGLIKGWARRDPQNGEKRIVVAHGTNIYVIPDNPAVPTSISSNVSSVATKVRFEQIDDKTIWADGEGAMRWWDGTNPESTVGGLSGTPQLVVAYKNRLFVQKKEEPTRWDFSDLYSFESWPAVNFFYVPNPKSPDHVVSGKVFQDNFISFTKKTKYVLSGDGSISQFTMKQAIGTKGAVSDEAIAVDRNYIYFMAEDKMIYRYNGVSDELISDKVQPALNGIQDVSKVRLTIHNNQLRVYYAKSPNVLVDQMLLYDLVYEQWFLDTGRPMLGGMAVDFGSNFVEFSSRCGWVFNGETGTSDAGKAIDWKYWTNYKAYTSGAAKDRIKRFRPILRAAAGNYSMLVGRDIDFKNKPDMRAYSVNGDGATWGGGETWGGGAVWGSTKLIDRPAPMSGRGKHTQYRFEKKGVDTPIELYGYISMYKSGRAR